MCFQDNQGANNLKTYASCMLTCPPEELFAKRPRGPFLTCRVGAMQVDLSGLQILEMQMQADVICPCVSGMLQPAASAKLFN